MAQYDLIICGGGIGGSALAAVMARAGNTVLLLEGEAEYKDRVRGEWIAPWGVAETKRVGLYDALIKAGGHHLTRHVTYDENLAPDFAEQHVLDMAIFAPGISGPLCIGHPKHCQTLFDEAQAAGATCLRPARVTGVTLGAAPQVTYLLDEKEHTATARLIVGADGRTSTVRQAAGVPLNQDKPHHWFAGLLVEGVDGWDENLQAIGTEGDFGFLAFPQGGGKVRVYGGYALDEKRHYAGAEGARRFLDAFAMRASPNNEALVAGTPAGPCLAYFNHDTWTDQPFGEGFVLVGDAAGWNDPIVGLGLSITYRDVRLVSEILKSGSADFRPYAEERAERMRRLRFAAGITSALDMEFGPEAAARRLSYFERRAADASLGIHAFAIMAGPESVPVDFFTEAHRARVLQS